MTTILPRSIPDLLIEPLVRLALMEDLVPAGDITSDSVVTAETQIELLIRSREHGVLAGTDAARLAVKLIDRDVACDWRIVEGAALQPGEIIGVLRGNARSILMAEHPNSRNMHSQNHARFAASGETRRSGRRWRQPSPLFG